MSLKVFPAAKQAELIAGDISEVIAEALKRQPKFNLVLTGGTLGIDIAGALARENVEWDRVRIWFGDERFVSLTDPDRNEAQALAVWPALAELNLIRFPAPPISLSEAAKDFDAWFGQEFGSIEESDSVFDLVLLGMGPDGHVASLFPGHAHPKSWVVAEENSPKPPAQRLSLSYEALNRSRRVWVVVSGAAKREALKSALSSAELPAAKVTGMEETRWLVDEEVSDGL